MRNFFLEADRILKLWERFGSRRIRTRPIRRREVGAGGRAKFSDGLGAIYPSMMYVVMTLDLLGYPRITRTGGSDHAVHEPAGGRPTRLLLPAVLLRAVGYGDRGVCAGRIRRSSRRSAGTRGRLDADARRSAAKATGP